MRKCLILFLFFFAAVFAFTAENIVFAGDTITFEGFPLYPPGQISAQITDGTATFSLDFLSPELRVKFETDREAFFESARQEISTANEYLQNKAKEFGWMTIIKSWYSDGGSDLFIFAKKTQNKIIVVETSVWHGFAFAGKPLSEKWGTIRYEFFKYPVPLAYRDCPLIPGIFSIAAYEKKTDEAGNEVLKVEIKKALGEEKFCLFYSGLYVHNILQRLYGWQEYKIKHNVMNKLAMRGSYKFFLKNNQLIRYGSYSSELVFYTPQEQQRIMRFVEVESKKKPIEPTIEEQRLMQMKMMQERKEKEQAQEKLLKSRKIRRDADY